MKFVLESQIKLLSVNEAYATIKSGRRIKSNEYKNFTTTILMLMRSHRNAYRAFELAFNPKVHEIFATLERGTPAFYTNAGTISRISGDVPNYEKCLTDCVMIGQIDDSAITEWRMRKFPAPKHCFRLTLEIRERPPKPDWWK